MHRLRAEPEPASPTNHTGQFRSNDAHESTSDPQAKLLKRGSGKGVKRCATGHAVMENRHGLRVSFELTPSVGVTESHWKPKGAAPYRIIQPVGGFVW